MKLKELEQKYKQKQEAWKQKIRSKPSRWSRFWGWVWYLIAFPIVWIAMNIRDWRTFVIFAIVNVVLSSEIWIPYTIAIFCWSNEPLRNSMIAFGSACWLFWAGPFTPFLLICVFVTIGIKALFNKIKSRKKDLKK